MMNAPLSNIQQARIAAADAEERMRIATACRIASGMLANPRLYEDRNWQNTVAFESVNLADKIIQEVRRS